MRKAVAVVLVLSMSWWLMAPGALAQSAVGPPGLVQIEEILYGRAMEGALLERLERAEIDVLGEPQEGSAFLVRLQRLVNLLTGAEGEISIKMKLNAIEWAMFQRVNEGPSIGRRLDHLETAMYGEIQRNMGLVERLNSLLELMWPGGRVYVAQTVIPQGTLVKIELLTEVDSGKSKVNDSVRYRIVEDVRIDNQIAIAAGTEGVGTVISVDTAGRLGQDGLVQVDFGTTRAMDSTPVRLRVDERATERNKSLELAAGASLAGVVLLGPIGLAAGYFVQGRQHVIPVGTQFFVEVAADTRVEALSLMPVNR